MIKKNIESKVDEMTLWRQTVTWPTEEYSQDVFEKFNNFAHSSTHFSFALYTSADISVVT